MPESVESPAPERTTTPPSRTRSASARNAAVPAWAPSGPWVPCVLAGPWASWVREVGGAVPGTLPVCDTRATVLARRPVEVSHVHRHNRSVYPPSLFVNTTWLFG